MKTSPNFFFSISLGFKHSLINSNNSLGLSIKLCNDILKLIDILYVLEFLSKYFETIFFIIFIKSFLFHQIKHISSNISNSSGFSCISFNILTKSLFVFLIVKMQVNGITYGRTSLVNEILISSFSGVSSSSSLSDLSLSSLTFSLPDGSSCNSSSSSLITIVVFTLSSFNELANDLFIHFCVVVSNSI